MQILHEVSSPNYEERKVGESLDKIIIHYTGMIDTFSALKRLCSRNARVSAHFLIDGKGKIWQLVSEEKVSWHAGISSWQNKTNLNYSSLGIELCNPGHDYGYLKFPEKQISSLESLLRKLIDKYNIRTESILGHSDIAPSRKKDPGERFPWKILYNNNIGIWHDLNSKKLIKLRMKKVSALEINLFFRNLKKFGYFKKKINAISKKKYDKLLVEAFQRRFRPEQINGKIDQECLIIIKKLTNT